MTQTETTYWNGEPCVARRLEVVVPEWCDGDPPLAWWKPHQGEVRQAVLVEYYDERYLLDDDRGDGWSKVTEGRGSPRRNHRDLPLRSVEVRADRIATGICGRCGWTRAATLAEDGTIYLSAYHQGHGDAPNICDRCVAWSEERPRPRPESGDSGGDS